jgi:hypothetical protein
MLKDFKPKREVSLKKDSSKAGIKRKYSRGVEKMEKIGKRMRAGGIELLLQ